MKKIFVHILQVLIILCSPAVILCETTCAPRNWNETTSLVFPIKDVVMTDVETVDADQGLYLLQKSARVHAVTRTSAELSRKESANDHEVHNIISKLWNGEDVTEGELHTIRGRLSHFTRILQRGASPVPRARHTATKLVDKRSHVKRVHILGPPDSGTNLLAQTLAMNFPDQIPEACQHSANPRSPMSCDPSVWKHSISSKDDLYTRFMTCQEQLCKTKGTQKTSVANAHDAAVIIMVRSPISQMVSWRFRPYSLQPCFARPWDQALSPCFANTAPEWHDSVEGCVTWKKSDRSLVFDTAVDVYNAYIRQYLALQHDQRIGPVILINYEELVVDPGSVMDRIGKVLDWPIGESWQILERDAKQNMGGSISSGRSEAVEKVTKRSFLDDLSAYDVAMLCSGLNKSLLTGLYEKNPSAAKNRSYLYDC